MPEGSSTGPAAVWVRDGATDGVRNRGTPQEDAPVTWETLVIPRAAGGRSQCKGQPEPRPKVARESEDRIRATKPGNARPADPAEQRRSVLW